MLDVEELRIERGIYVKEFCIGTKIPVSTYYAIKNSGKKLNEKQAKAVASFFNVDDKLIPFENPKTFDMDKAIEMYEAGVDAIAIGKAIGYSGHFVKRKMRALGYSFKDSENDYKDVRMCSGMSSNAASADYGAWA